MERKSSFNGMKWRTSWSSTDFDEEEKKQEVEDNRSVDNFKNNFLEFHKS